MARRESSPSSHTTRAEAAAGRADREPGRDASHAISVQIPATAEAAAIARRSLDAFDATLDDGLLYELRLLATELVTNSVLHGRLESESSIEFEVSVADERTRVEVSDRGRGFVPPERGHGDGVDEGDPEPELRGSGWGLHLVEQLSDRWGVVRNSATRVWFEIDIHAGRRAASPLAA